MRRFISLSVSISLYFIGSLIKDLPVINSICCRYSPNIDASIKTSIPLQTFFHGYIPKGNTTAFAKHYTKNALKGSQKGTNGGIVTRLEDANHI